MKNVHPRAKCAATFHRLAQFLSLAVADEMTTRTRWEDVQQREFVSAIEEEASRLEALQVYADWLEDREDKLSTMIRAELEQRL